MRVARVKVVANTNPELLCLSLPGEVTIIILPYPAPRSAFPNAAAPEPSDGFLTTIRNHLETRRLVTTNIHVIGPLYKEVKVTCNVFLKKRVSQNEASKNINQALADFFDPVLGGPQKGMGWPFGRSAFPSEVSQQIARLPGVDYVTNVAINDLEPGARLKLPYNGLPLSGKHAVTIVAFEDRGRLGETGGEGGEGGNCE